MSSKKSLKKATKSARKKAPTRQTFVPPPPPSQAERKAFERLVAGTSLEQVSLLSVKAEFYAHHIEKGLDLVVHVTDSAYRYSVAGDKLNCGSRLAVVLGPADTTEPDHAVATFEAEHLLTYVLPSGTGFPERSLRLFASRNGIFNAWPFFRELVHSMSTRMGIPQVVVPLLRLPPVKPPTTPPKARAKRAKKA